MIVRSSPQSVSESSFVFAGRSRRFVPDLNACFQLFAHLARHRLLRMHEIGLWHMLYRGKQPMRKRPVVCNQQKPLGVLVQPSHRKQTAPQLGRKQLEHGIVALIAACRDNAHRLVEHVVPLCAVALHGAIHRRCDRSGSTLNAGSFCTVPSTETRPARMSACTSLRLPQFRWDSNLSNRICGILSPPPIHFFYKDNTFSQIAQ